MWTLNERFAVSSGGQHHFERTGTIVKQAAKTTAVAVALITAVWLIEEVRLFGLVMIPTAVVAALLVVYFDWRAKLLSESVAERNAQRKAA